MSSCTQTILQARQRASPLALFALPVGNRTFHPFFQTTTSSFLNLHPVQPPLTLQRCGLLHQSIAGCIHAWGAQHRLVAIRHLVDLTESLRLTSFGQVNQPHTLQPTSSHPFFQSSSIPQKLRTIIQDLRQVPLNSWVTRIHRVQTQSKQTHYKDLRIILSCSFEPTIFHRVDLSFERCLIKTSFQHLLS